MRSRNPTSCRHPREEPNAGKSHARICAGALGNNRSYRDRLVLPPAHGEWFCLLERVSLTDALHQIERDPHFAPFGGR